MNNKVKPNDTERHFVEILTNADLWQWFIREFGENWKARDWHYDGWWFEDGAFSYRICDIFDNHADGYNWSFHEDDFWRTIFVYVMKSHGYVITHNSGDEEDGFFRMASSQNVKNDALVKALNDIANWDKNLEDK